MSTQPQRPAPEGEPPCVAWLRAQLKNVSVAHEFHINAALAHIDRLTGENAALLKDKERLDSGRILLKVYGDLHLFAEQDLREAIDAALDPQTAQPNPDEHAGGNAADPPKEAE